MNHVLINYINQQNHYLNINALQFTDTDNSRMINGHFFAVLTVGYINFDDIFPTYVTIIYLYF